MIRALSHRWIHGHQGQRHFTPTWLLRLPGFVFGLSVRMIRHLIRRWDHWSERRGGAHDATPTWLLCIAGFGLGVTAMGLGEVILVLSS